MIWIKGTVSSIWNSIKNMVTSAVNALKGFSGQTGDILIPVYVGGTLFDEAVVSAQARMNLKSGGKSINEKG